MRLAFPLIVAILAVFGQAVRHGFVYDDFAILSRDLWHPPYTRPLTLLSFRFDLLAGAGAGHAFNLALHAANSLLVLDVLRRMIPVPAAQVAAVVFALHPLQAEPVNYIWARSTLLMTLFCLLSLRAQGWRAAGWFALALLSKEECVAFPLFLMLVKPVPLMTTAVMLATSVAAGTYTWWAANIVAGSQAGTQAVYSPVEYLSAQGFVILRYLWLLVLPTGPFLAEYDMPTGLWWAWLFVIALAIAAWRTGKAEWLLGGLMLLLPSSSIFPANDLAADRRMYLPMVAFSAALGHISILQRRPVLFALAGALGALSFVQSRHWRSDETLWTHVLAHNGRSVRARIHVGRARGDVRLLEEAKLMSPNDALVASELGRLYLEQQRIPDALKEFGRALALEPNSAQAMANRGVALLLLGQREAARADFERALAVDPCLSTARHNLRQMGVVPPQAACSGP